jgi:uncharacterized membrane protein
MTMSPALSAMAPILITHITAGGLAIVSGTAAIFVRKGERLHRIFGTMFVLCMFIMAAAATYMAVRIPEPTNILAGTFAFYLVASAWMTIKRKAGTVGLFEYGALFVIAGAGIVGVVFAAQVLASGKSMFEGVPPPMAYFIFVFLAALAAAFDLKVILKGGIYGVSRIARHLWRMCVAFFIATGSFFLGQQKIMPSWMHGSPILLGLALAPLIVMAFWLIRIRLANWYAAPAGSQ